MEVMPELGVDEVVDQWVDECGGHGQQVDAKVNVFYPRKLSKT